MLGSRESIQTDPDDGFDTASEHSKTSRKSISSQRRKSERFDSIRKSRTSLSSARSGRKSISGLDRKKHSALEEIKVKDTKKSRDLVLDEDFDYQSTDESSEETIKKEEVPASLSDEEFRQLKKFGNLDSESEESVQSDRSYLEQKELEIRPDFFVELGEIPSVAKISIEPSTESLPSALSQLDEEQEEEAEDQDVTSHKSVHKVASAKSSILGRKPSELARLTEAEGLDDLEDSEMEEKSEEEEIILPPEVEEARPVRKDDDGLDLWYAIETPKVVQLTETVDALAFERMENERKNREATMKFLHDLVDHVVNTCEYVDPNTILRQNLDKDKLMAELAVATSDLDFEQKNRMFLIRKTVEYYRRKKAFRSLLEDNPETIKQSIEKYKQAIVVLDQLLGREDELKKTTSLQAEELESKVFDMQQIADRSVQQLEELVQTSLHRDTFDKLPGIVKSQLELMAEFRNEISSVRRVLIQRQHTFAKLLEKSSQLEHLGDGLHMRDFDHLQTEVMALGKKIEERNAELNKLRNRCNADLHIMAHLKEKQQMLRNTIVIQEGAMRELTEEKHNARERLYMMKMDRNAIRKEIHELSFQGGLIDKPALMLDFDETIDKLQVLRVKVAQKIRKYNDLVDRIEMLEEEC